MHRTGLGADGAKPAAVEAKLPAHGTRSLAREAKPTARGTRHWAGPLVPLYRAGLWLADHTRGAPRQLRAPVVSVGSLSAGGAGKTPVVLMLARLLREGGVVVDVLSRGYRRTGTGVERVDPAGSAAHFGDEPMELAQAGCDVWVGRDRHAAGLAAEAASAVELHLLDDGFQHRRLHRDLDVVLLTARDLQDRLLPAGNLREPTSALARADVLVLREDEAAEIEPWCARHCPGKEIWRVRRELALPPGLPKRLAAFCGIARPDDFFAALRGAGCNLAGTLALRDHQRYDGPAMERTLTRFAAECRAEGFLTTAKDAVKLSQGMRRRMGGPPVATLQAIALDPEAVLRRLTALLPAGRRVR